MQMAVFDWLFVRRTLRAVLGRIIFYANYLGQGLEWQTLDNSKGSFNCQYYPKGSFKCACIGAYM